MKIEPCELGGIKVTPENAWEDGYLSSLYEGISFENFPPNIWEEKNTMENTNINDTPNIFYTNYPNVDFQSLIIATKDYAKILN